MALAVLAIRDHAWRSLAVAAGAPELVALVVFLVVVLPVNSKFPLRGSRLAPAGWMALRDRWEAGRATGFVLFTVAFTLLALAALGPSRPDLPPAGSR